MNVGHAIKICRQLRKMTQAELSEVSKISVPHLSLVEKNKREPSVSALEAIAQALRVPLSVLILIATSNDEVPEMNSGQLDMLSSAIKELMYASTHQSSLF